MARDPRRGGDLCGDVRRRGVREVRLDVPGVEVRASRGDAGQLPVVPGQQGPGHRSGLQQHGGAEQRRVAAGVRLVPRVSRFARRFRVDALERPGARRVCPLLRAHRRRVHLKD